MAYTTVEVTTIETQRRLASTSVSDIIAVGNAGGSRTVGLVFDGSTHQVIHRFDEPDDEEKAAIAAFRKDSSEVVAWTEFRKNL